VAFFITMIHFHKYQGTGNDFVMIDNRNLSFPVSKSLVAHLCHRRFGIGADGLILLQNHEKYDFEMVYFNADGNPSSMCGNGGRCLVKFAAELGIFKSETNFLAVDGAHEASIQGNIVSLKMKNVEKVEKYGNYHFLHTGSPHYVTFAENLKDFNVFEEGKKIRYSEKFASQGGTNVNFIEKTDENSLFVRTYERGVEDETYSCGTGVTAAAISASFFGLETPVAIQTPGGKLTVSFEKNTNGSFSNIYLTGAAEKVFEGEYSH
jgi:diaminopimelate epimerase